MAVSQWMSKAEHWLAVQPRAQPKLQRVDAFVGGALALIAGVLCAWLATQLSFLGHVQFNDTWYGADSYRVFSNLTDRTSNHYRTSVHPLFSLLVATPTIVAASILHLTPSTAIVVALTINAAVAIVLLFLVLRSFLPRLDATLFCLLFLSSAAFLFWFGAPETYAWGATSILFALAALTLLPYGRWWGLSMLASALTLSFTLTNWMAGLAATFLNHPVRKAVHISVYAFAVVAMLTAVQSLIYPTAGKFLYVRYEQRYVTRHPIARMTTKLDNFWISSLVARPPTQHRLISTNEIHAEYTLLSTQKPRTAIGSVAAVAWLALLGLAAWQWIADPRFRILKLAVGTVIVGQCLLHIAYGSEPFLYVGHYFPVLLIAAAFACATRLRPLALVLAVVAMLAGGYNNYAQFSRSTELIRAESEACEHDLQCDSDADTGAAKEGE